MKKLLQLFGALVCLALPCVPALAQAVAPVISPAAGSYVGTQSVTCTSTTTGADIFYTVDGSTPTPESTKYTGAISVSSSQTVKCIAAVAGVRRNNIQNDSPSAGGTYWKPADSSDTGGNGTPTGLVHSSGHASPSLSGASMEFAFTGQTGKQTNVLWAVSGGFGKCDTCSYRLYDYYLYDDAGTCSASATTEQDVYKFASSLGSRYMGGAQWRRGTGGCASGHQCLDIGGNSNTGTGGSTWVNSGVSTTLFTCGAWHHFQRAEHSVPSEVTTKPCTDFRGAKWPYLYEDYWIVDGTRFDNGGAGWKYCANALPGGWGSVDGPQHQGDVGSGGGSWTEYLDNANYVSYFPASSVSSAAFTIAGGTPTTATPSFSPAAGSYTSTQLVTLSDSTPSSTIYYTTNGSTPTTSSSVYSTPISVASTETIKAIATASGFAQSALASALYTITTPAPAPGVVFSPAPGTYAGSVVVTMTDSMSGANIFYTLDGSTPTTASTPYTGPITIASTTTVKAIATASATPSFVQGAVNYTTSISDAVAFTSANTAGNAIVVDGLVQENFPGAGSMSVSDSQGNSYSAVITQEQNNVLAITWVALNVHAGANTVTVTYSTSTTHPGMVAAIHEYANVKTSTAVDVSNFAQAATSTGIPLSTSVTTTQANDILHYFASAENPNALVVSGGAGWASREAVSGGTVVVDTSDRVASAPGAVSNSITNPMTDVFYAGYLVALRPGSTASVSPVTSGVYTISGTTPTPVFSPPAGTYPGTVAVTVTDSAPSPTIYCTTDGSTPTTSSTVYTAPLTISTTTTVKCIATSSGLPTSAVGVALYTIGACAPLGRGTIDYQQIKPAERLATGPFFQMAAGSAFTLNDLMVYDTCGNSKDSGLLYTSVPTKSAIQQESYVYAADTGTANAYAITLTPAPTLVAGSTESFIVGHTNTGASTLATNGGSAIAVKKGAGATALAAGDWTAGQMVTVKYDGTNWQWGGGGSSGGSGPTLQVNGTPNGSQTLLNLKAGTGTTINDDGVGGVTIAATGGGGGSFVLVEAHTASGSASLNFTTCLTSTYDEYSIEMIGMIPATNGAILDLRFSTNGGSSYDTSGIYDWSFDNNQLGGGGGSKGGAGSAGLITLSCNDGILSSALPGVVGNFKLYDPLSATNQKLITGQATFTYSGDSNRYTYTLSGDYRSTTAVNAFQVFMSSGNIASGTVRCYGIAH
jgi:hypothetical protein